MNVYVEANFVLELAFLQEQAESCEEILRLSEEERLSLVVPAYSLVEPYETLVRRLQQRRKMKDGLDAELRLLTRTSTYTERLSGFQDLTALLIDSADEEFKHLETVRERLLKTGQIIALDIEILDSAAGYRRRHDLSPQDALVYASVASHLSTASGRSCFLNRNSRDFNDPDIVDELKRRGCTLIPRFDDGLRHIHSRLAG